MDASPIMCQVVDVIVEILMERFSMVCLKVGVKVVAFTVADPLPQPPTDYILPIFLAYHFLKRLHSSIMNVIDKSKTD